MEFKLECRDWIVMQFKALGYVLRGCGMQEVGKRFYLVCQVPADLFESRHCCAQENGAQGTGMSLILLGVIQGEVASRGFREFLADVLYASSLWGSIRVVGKKNKHQGQDAVNSSCLGFRGNWQTEDGEVVLPRVLGDIAVLREQERGGLNICIDYLGISHNAPQPSLLAGQ